MSMLFLRASLALWKRRYNYRSKRLAAANRSRNRRRIDHWHHLLIIATAMIHRRERQIAMRRPYHKSTMMPGTIFVPRASAGALFKGVPGKLVWHTTEGNSDPTSTLDANGDHPHFAVLRDGTILQYMAINQTAKALKHTQPTETNRANAVQVEVVGTAADPNWPSAQMKACKEVARFIERNAGVNQRCAVTFHPPATGGVSRLSNSEWIRYSGHCGHQHVPQNDHVDPGQIDMKEILSQ